ncbi:MAG TPA: DUF2163 domain-containing protein [Phenylobacterium sp.]
MTDATITQAGADLLLRSLPGGRATQAGAEVLHKVQPGARATQGGAEVLLRVQPDNAVTQAGVEYLYKAIPCATRWAQIWTITRADGETYRFTSLDRALAWNGQSYKACDSLVPSAAESSDEVGGVGSLDLAGILSDESVSAADLRAGRFDGARVEAWVVPWAGDPEIPHRLLAGTFGRVGYGEAGWKVELVGDGARLQQTPLLRAYTPGCRWVFGGAECGKAPGPLTVAGSVETGGQKSFIDTGRAEAAGYFRFGVVSFTSGENAGIAAEIRDHGAGGVFTLWPRLANPIAAGDAYTMTPGCTNDVLADGGTNGCAAWANVVNYGGFPDVPGADALAETPHVKG